MKQLFTPRDQYAYSMMTPEQEAVYEEMALEIDGLEDEVIELSECDTCTDHEETIQMLQDNLSDRDSHIDTLCDQIADLEQQLEQYQLPPDHLALVIPIPGVIL